MGEAARRRAEIAALKVRNAVWLDSLSPIERTIAVVAQATYDRVVVGMSMTEACYNLAFFLQEHLRRKHEIQTEVVVGWINDGQWEGAASHAWLEYHGKKTDISLHKTSHPDSQPPGDLIIIDHVVKRGECAYTYWTDLPAAAEQELRCMRNESQELAGIVAHKDREHARIHELSKLPDGANQYFRDAPPQCSYEYLARVVG
ncbi:hypothetical protein [Dechloromonas sp. CZR5]|uniref:hypothetical protein n=1 Tax=Dechloromonas sp. CZR5 TaxID=2608630 RepID=UPI00123DB82C|nr:hypothetical protein [Dechloromonas sp. CZR5]